MNAPSWTVLTFQASVLAEGKMARWQGKVMKQEFKPLDLTKLGCDGEKH